jgi:hypothetical protein
VSWSGRRLSEYLAAHPDLHPTLLPMVAPRASEPPSWTEVPASWRIVKVREMPAQGCCLWITPVLPPPPEDERGLP